jgi:cation diffusion facilitator CzcD-associated flavoprotein CzcO
MIVAHVQGLKVAVIGSAASAIQAVVEVAKVARALTVFQRTPNWLLPKENYEYTRTHKFLFQVPPVHIIFNLVLLPCFH